MYGEMQMKTARRDGTHAHTQGRRDLASEGGTKRLSLFSEEGLSQNPLKYARKTKQAREE